MKKHLIAAALLALAATPAFAYTAYVQPDAYWPEDSDVRVRGAFASQFFTPQIATQSSFILLGPDGARLPSDYIDLAPEAATLHAELPRQGTYRISTGEQLGAVATLVGVDGQWRQLGQGEAAPEGAPVRTLQTVTLADTYVTRGQPSSEVLAAPGGRLLIRPVTHPNQVLAAQGMQVDVLFDGQPLANAAVVLYAQGDPDTKLDRFAVTDANGRATFNFDGPGVYVIAARYRADMPAGSAAQVASFTSTLTVEALSALPAGYDVAERERQQEREQRRQARRELQRRGRLN